MITFGRSWSHELDSNDGESKAQNDEKKINSLNLNSLKRTGRCFEHVFQTKKFMKTPIISTAVEGRHKMKEESWLDCTKVTKKFESEKCT